MSDWQVEWEQPGPITLSRVAEWKREAERLLAETMEGPYSVIVTLCDHILAPPAVRVTGEMVRAGRDAAPAWNYLNDEQMAAILTAALAVSFPIQQDWRGKIMSNGQTDAVTALLDQALEAHAAVADTPEAADDGWERLCALRDLVPSLCRQIEQMQTALYLAVGGLRAMRADARLVGIVEDAAVGRTIQQDADDIGQQEKGADK